jgi:hypothetical protein
LASSCTNHKIIQYVGHAVCIEFERDFSPAAECDIQYVDPSAYVPPDDGIPRKMTLDQEDPYEKIVRGNLQRLDKIKVS